MIIVLTGESGTGKSLIEKMIMNRGYNKIIRCTTREPRKSEKNGIDYHFINKKTFQKVEFAEYEEYSGERFYGTLKYDIIDGGDKVCVLTPPSIRQIKKNMPYINLFVVYLTSDLGTRKLRYINRIGVREYTYDDELESMARVHRDFGMFLGIQQEADLSIRNNMDSNPDMIVEEILQKARRIKERNI